VTLLYLDENVSEKIGGVLAALGIDAISANERYKGMDDPTQLLIARRLGRVLVTHNTSDFALLHQAWIIWSADWNVRPLPRHGGILPMHSATGYDPRHTAAEIEAFANDTTPRGSIENRAFRWREGHGWHER
jgi:hypothetical protein